MDIRSGFIMDLFMARVPRLLKSVTGVGYDNCSCIFIFYPIFRVLSLHSENASLKSEHSQSVAQLTAQTEMLRSSFREQLHHLQDEHRSTVETLQHQINSLETQLFQLQKEPAITGKRALLVFIPSLSLAVVSLISNYFLYLAHNKTLVCS